MRNNETLDRYLLGYGCHSRTLGKRFANIKLIAFKHIPKGMQHELQGSIGNDDYYTLIKQIQYVEGLALRQSRKRRNTFFSKHV